MLVRPKRGRSIRTLLKEAGLPDGVLNVITTARSGAVMEPLIRDSRVRKLTFTGSTDVGRRLVEQSAEQLLRVSMELGGNAPFLVLADADLDDAVDGAMLAKMRNMGEACTAANRFLVHGSVEEFTARLAARMGGLRLGRGTEAGVQVGPMIDAPSRDKIADLVDEAVDGGAEVVVGGSTTGEHGWFYQPTVLRNVSPEAGLLQEEIFGPVAPVTSFDTLDEALELSQLHRVRLGRLCLHRRPRRRTSSRRGARHRHGGHQPGGGVEPRCPLRGSEGVGLRA